ncbi:MAG: class II fumarate hydratase [Desulfurococcales archaeon]|nr:class II fumarate hydratase [Desulfurococcales archaeon]
MKYVGKAVEVFLSTGTRFPRDIIWAMGLVKYAAARANRELGLLEEPVAEAIMKASMEVAEGAHDDKIVVDVFQTGSGTGLNMNVNEVIASRATEILGRKVHPNDHVNMSQSSNDVVPTAVRVAALKSLRDRVIPSLKSLIGELKRLEERVSDVVKPGRTHFRDALPVRMDQEFRAFRDAFERHLEALAGIEAQIREVPLGGTAVGTGLNAHPRYIELAVKYLSEASGLDLAPATSRFRAMRLLTDLVVLSGAYRAIALDLWRLGQDLRIMYSGPFTGIAEIDMPQEIPGSSMMPGKVNPVTIEAAMQASAQVVGLDHSNTMANLLGELELSMGIPLVGYNVVTQSILLGEALGKMASLVVARVKANKERARDLAFRSQALITVISPIIGYEKAAEVSRMLYEGKTIEEALKALGFTGDEIDRILDMSKLTEPGIPALELRKEKK